MNQKTGEIRQTPPPVASEAQGDMLQYGRPNYVYPGSSDRNKKPKKPRERKGYDPFTQAVMGAITTFFNEVRDGTVKDAINAAFYALSQGIAQAAAQSIQQAIPGPAGGILGAVAGGVIGLIGHRLFGKSGVKHDKPHVYAEITNWPDPMKQWTLPSSAYYQPSRNSALGSIVQRVNIQNTITGGPKVADRVIRASSGTRLRDSLRRGLG